MILLTFTLGGQSFQALNGGTPANYGTAASISVECSDQAEVDRLWTALTADGGTEIMCGWLRDRWGVPWQIVPGILPRLLANPDPTVSARVFAAMRRWSSWTSPPWSVRPPDEAGHSKLKTAPEA